MAVDTAKWDKAGDWAKRLADAWKDQIRDPEVNKAGSTHPHSPEAVQEMIRRLHKEAAAEEVPSSVVDAILEEAYAAVQNFEKTEGLNSNGTPSSNLETRISEVTRGLAHPSTRRPLSRR